MVRIPDLLVSTGSFESGEVAPQSNALQGIGAAGVSVGKFMKEKEERDTQLFWNENGYKFKNDQLAKFEDLKLKHDDIDTFTDTFDKQFDEASSKLLTDAGDGIDAEAVQDKFRQLKSSFIENSINYQVQEKASLFKQGREQAADDIVKGALIDGNFDGASKELQGIYGSMADQTTPSEIKDFRQRTTKNLAVSRIKQAIESKPESVDDLVVEYADDLEAADIDSLRGQAVAQAKIIEAKYEKQLEKRQDKARFEVYTKLLEDPASIDAAALTTMVNNNDLDPDDAEGLLKLKTTGDDIKDNLYVLSEIDQKRNLGTLTVSDVIKHHSNGKLTQSTAQDYIKSINSGVLESPAAKQGLAIIESAYKEEAFGVRTLDDQAALVRDKQEFWERLSGDPNFVGPQKPQSPIEIADEIVNRAKTTQSLKDESAARIKRYKRRNSDLITEEDFKERKAGVLRAFNTKRMTQAEAEVEVGILDEILRDMAE